MTSERKKAIEQTVDELVAQEGTCCPFELCERLGIGLLTQDLPESVRGFSLELPHNRVIVLSAGLPAAESRAVCAHELGHIFLHPGTNSVELLNRTTLCVARLEQQADYFAACVLLYDTDSLWSLSYESATAEDISRLTGVPERLVRLRFFPAAEAV